MKRRIGLELPMDILRAVEQASMPTHIMYKSLLDWSTLMKYLSYFIEKGLVRMETTTKKAKSSKRTRTIKRYYLTEKGKETLNLWRNLKRELNV